MSVVKQTMSVFPNIEDKNHLEYLSFFKKTQASLTLDILYQSFWRMGLVIYICNATHQLKQMRYSCAY